MARRPSPTTLRTTSGATLADLARQLRLDAGGDAQARELRDALGALSAQIEALARARHQARRAQDLLAQVDALAQALRRHSHQLTALDPHWHALPECDAYAHGLAQLQDTLQAWQDALHQGGAQEPRVFSAFEVQAWRALGQALVLLDFHDDDPLPAPVQPRGDVPPRRVGSALARLRRWWRM